LGTDIRYLISASSWVLLGKFAGMLVTFVVSIAFARYLLKGTYGEYRYIFSLIGIASIFSLPGVGQTIVRSVARGFSGTFRRGIRIIFISSFGMSAVLFGFAVYFMQINNTALFLGLIVAAILVPFMEGLGGWRTYLDGKKEFKRKTKINIVIHFIYSTLMLATVLAIYKLEIPLEFSVALLVATYLITRAIPNIFILKKIYKTTPKDSKEEPQAIRYGLHLSASNIPGTVATYLDNLLLFHFLGPVSVAIYSFAIVFPEQIKALLSSFSAVGFPKLAEKSGSEIQSENIKKTLPKKIMRATLLSAAIVVLYIIVAPYFYEIFFPRYLESVRLSQIFALSLITFPFAFFGTALVVEGNVKKIYFYRFGIPIVQIVALAVMVPMFGIWGAVYGRLLGRYFQHAALFILYKI
jgi:O-antigen/teichoic acid export membrane protein